MQSLSERVSKNNADCLIVVLHTLFLFIVSSSRFTNSRSLLAHMDEHEGEESRLRQQQQQRDEEEDETDPDEDFESGRKRRRKKKQRQSWSSGKKGVRSLTSAPENNKPPAAADEAKATCPQCGKTFRRHFNMRIHVDRVHNKVKPFPCNYCNKAFATNSDLKQHVGVHGQGNRFECEECGRT